MKIILENVLGFFVLLLFDVSEVKSLDLRLSKVQKK